MNDFNLNNDGNNDINTNITHQDTFVFRRKWRDVIRIFPNDLRLKAYDTIFDYALDGIEPKDDIAVEIKTMHALIKSDIDAAKAKFAKKAAAGKKGMAKRWEKNKTVTPSATDDQSAQGSGNAIRQHGKVPMTRKVSEKSIEDVIREEYDDRCWIP